MSVCTFFGHRDCPAAVRPKLRAVLAELIEQYGVEQFYVGRQGAFDAMVRSVLRELAEEYPGISYAVVLERLPGPRDEAVRDFSDTIFRGDWRRFRPALPSPGATSGCSGGRTSW